MYVAYLLLCMVSPVGGEYCTPAMQRIIVPTEEKCLTLIKREIQYLKEESSLEEFRAHLPSMIEGKLRIKWACSTPTEQEWLLKDLPKIQPPEGE